MGKTGNVSKSFSAKASDYKLLEEVGYGASATVFRAIYLPLNEVVAVKCLDLDRCNSNLFEGLASASIEVLLMNIRKVLYNVVSVLNLRLTGIQDGADLLLLKSWNEVIQQLDGPGGRNCLQALKHGAYMSLDDIRREAQTMSLIDHPNVVRAYCSFVVDRNLWVVMPFMAEGSCLHLMKIAYPDGFEELAICSILKETLKALEYLHRHGHIHRDVKAGNILLDTNGQVKLADFGVSACMFDSGDRQRSRNTFVGTPCWMAPEVLQPNSGYDFKADIWSFGITALELAHGHAPFSKYPPMKVLLMTIQNAPPGLDYDRDKKFSKGGYSRPVTRMPHSVRLVKIKPCAKNLAEIVTGPITITGRSQNLSVILARPVKICTVLLFDGLSIKIAPYTSFKEMVAMCLVKDPAKRPTAEKLLKHSFFKHAKPPELSLKKLFTDLPPLWDRVKALQLKDAAQLALKRMPSAEQEAISQSEYKRGVSAWNFDIEDLKAQASLVQDDDDLPDIREGDESVRSAASSKDASESGSVSGKSFVQREQTQSDELSPAANDGADDNAEIGRSELLYSHSQVKTVLEKEVVVSDTAGPASGRDSVQVKAKSQPVKGRQSQSGPLMPGIVLGQTSSERGRVSESRPENENQPALEKSNVRRAPSFSGPLMLPTRASANSLSAPIKSSGGYRDSLEDKSKANLVQIKGRFSVTSQNVDLAKGSPLRKSASVGDWMSEPKQTVSNQPSKDICTANFSSSLLLPHLQNLFQQTAIQQDLIMSLLSNLQSSEVVDGSQNGKLQPAPLLRSPGNGSVEVLASERERSLLAKISELQARLVRRMISLTEELNTEKQRYVLLQQQLNALPGQEEDEEQIKVIA
ncbi:hypothetical protein Cgig2_026901 [Carnegiea gigantea]|uniref:Protein kinase domain-containing protein n=1 Tax=Carnegiea gigantea TaxID=171969 RepID=A0A9Q1QQS5_9CARY|nr:hypothetical protein Cgig2_026901 [Carnegiea gigantea]